MSLPVERAEQVFQGLGVSPGIAIGRAVSIASQEHEIIRFPIPPDRIDEEIARLDEALGKAQAEIEAMRLKAGAELGAELAGVFEAHSLMLNDAAFVGKLRARIAEERVNAEWAVHETAEDLASRFARLEAERFREKSQDLVDVSRHLLRCLGAISHHDISELEGEIIVVAHDLTPSEAIRLGRNRVVGFALETGGRTSHTAIIARSLHIPLVTGLPGVTELVTDDDPVIVDGNKGLVTLHATAESIASSLEERVGLQKVERSRLSLRSLKAETRDGASVELLANIDLPEEIDEAGFQGADGVGLYRSEFLYIERSPELPTEEEQLTLYQSLLEAMSPRPVVVRTFDLGGRKLAREVLHTEEENPSLGLRGIRLTLNRKEIFEVQVRALLRAAPAGNLRVMLPMISTLDEVHQFKALLKQAASELEREGLEFSRDFDLGIMIEVPSAAVLAPELAREVDFFSIGTNDLIQYSLAVDRNNEHVSYLYKPFHPAILRMVRWIVDGARESGIDVSVCGEAAADPRVAPLLVALGAAKLSMSPASIPVIKAAIRAVSLDEITTLAEECLLLSTTGEVEDRVDEFLLRDDASRRAFEAVS